MAARRSLGCAITHFMDRAPGRRVRLRSDYGRGVRGGRFGAGDARAALGYEGGAGFAWVDGVRGIGERRLSGSRRGGMGCPGRSRRCTRGGWYGG